MDSFQQRYRALRDEMAFWGFGAWCWFRYYAVLGALTAWCLRYLLKRSSVGIIMGYADSDPLITEVRHTGRGDIEIEVDSSWTKDRIIEEHEADRQVRASGYN